MLEHPERIAFVVEGDADRDVAETLAKRVWAALPERFHTVRLGGRAAIPWLWNTVLTLLEEKDYEHVVVLLDADTIDGDEAYRRVAELEAELSKRQIAKESVSILLAVPELEAWLLAETEENPEVLDAKQRLQQRMPKHQGKVSPNTLANLARTLNLPRARERSPSLNSFLAVLESLHP
ncbi:MAG: DUF4276 family protein [Myxococcota bacterium]